MPAKELVVVNVHAQCMDCVHGNKSDIFYLEWYCTAKSDKYQLACGDPGEGCDVCPCFDGGGVA